jgi:hypothetical protein
MSPLSWFVGERRRPYALAALAGFVLGAAWVLYAVLTSTNSTTAIGLLFVPVYGGLAAVLSCALAFVVFTFADWNAGRLAGGWPRLLLAAAIAVAGAGWGGAYWTYRDALRIASDPAASPQALIEVSKRRVPLWSEEVVDALAKNPATPPNLLTAIVEAGAGHYLVSLVGANPNAPVVLLERIAAGPLGYERVAGLAGNPRITPAIAERLGGVKRADFRSEIEFRLYQTFVLAELVRNPSIPQALFDRLAAWEQPEHFLAVAVIYAERSSCAQIRRAAQGGSEVLNNTAQSQLRQRGCTP